MRDDDPDIDPRVRRITTRGLEVKSFSTLTYGLTSTIHAMIKRPDVALVMNCANGYWLPLLKWRGIPTAVNVDGIEWERAKWGRTARAVFKLGAKMTARFADVIISDAYEIGRRWSTEFNRESIFIPYGGDIPGVLATPDGLPKHGYILAVARFVPENSIPEFFEAVKLMNGKYPVVIVGSTGYGGPMDEAAQALARQYDNVTWLGHVSDDQKLQALWRNAGAYFHGHSVGGTNPALVQAMACGSPVVARDTPYNREVLGDSGVFVAPNASAIAHALSERVQEVLEGRFDSRTFEERCRLSYSWDIVCTKYDTTARMLFKTHLQNVPADLPK